MGNSPSKSKAPALTRTDTAGSTKSSRSIRSRMSRDDAASYKTAVLDSPQLGPKSPKVSRKNSSNSASGDRPVMGSRAGSVPDVTASISSLHILNDPNLPPSMIQIEPKQPILMRRNTNDSEFPLTPKKSAYGAEGGLSRTSTRGSTHSQSVLSSSLQSNAGTLDGGPAAGAPGVSADANGANSGSIGYSGHLTPTPGTADKTDYSLSIDRTESGTNTPMFELDSISRTSTRGSAGGVGESLGGNGSASNSRANSSSNTNTNLLANLRANGSSDGVAEVQKTIDIEDLIQRLLDAGYSGKRTKNVCLKNSEIQLVCSKAREIFLLQPSLLELSPPVKVVGDVHGQYGDLIRVFTKCGFPPLTNYLFLGDYVDRGKQSLETILLLLCYKIKYPENFFLLRGNHECANVTRVYGFYDECKRRCNIKTWKLFIDTFNTLPIAAIVAGKIFCVHGGLSPVLNSMDEIRNIVRPTDVPDFGLLNDLLWSDPADTTNEWEDNERGVSYVFSKVAINKFLQKFGFDLVCRAHMVVEDGYEFFNDRTLVTVFSAPNYCGEFDNWGAVMGVSDELLCLFELLDPLDSVALKQVMKKGKAERKSAQLQQQQQQLQRS